LTQGFTKTLGKTRTPRGACTRNCEGRLAGWDWISRIGSIYLA